MLIARRADTRARADFATWKMMAKLNGASALPQHAQDFLLAYQKFLKQMTEADASEATIAQMYRSYYAEMGGGGAPPDIPARQSEPAPDNVTAFRRPAPKPKPKPAASYPSGQATKPRLPVALIFICLVVVYVGIRYLWQ
ncbi:hypothetical protein [Bradyrhizobium sp.]|uniref:hypothetical protein n=1 Tax=Bradyrhizobium sp. TaxID=376 RepID=UPI004037C0DD